MLPPRRESGDHGWTDSHLHEFEIEKDDKHFGIPGEDGELDTEDEYPVSLAQLLGVEGDSLVYRYDFGDDWVHELRSLVGRGQG